MNQAVNYDKNVQLKSSFYNTKKKIAVIYNIDSVNFCKNGKQSFVADLLTGTDKFEKPFKSVSSKIPLEPLIKDLYKKLFTQKNHDLIEIDLNLNDLKSFNRFKETSDIKTKYYKYDIRSLKKEGIDALLLVSAKYFMSVEYDGVFRENEEISCIIESMIIDLNDNSIMHDDSSADVREIDNIYYGDNPDYKNLMNIIMETIQTAINKEKSKLSL